MAKKKGMKLIANNKKAFHDYFIEDTYEAGIALAGTEVKSCAWVSVVLRNQYVENERFTSTECISALMKKAIFSTKTR